MSIPTFQSARDFTARILRPLSSLRASEVALHPSMRPAWIVLGLGLVISILIWRLVDIAIMDEARDRFRILTSRVIAKTHLTMATYEQVLRGAVGLLKVRNGITRREFGRFATAIELSQSHPGLRGLGYLVLIQPDELGRHVAKVRQSGVPNYRIRPAGKRKIYSSVLFREPHGQPNARTLGFDMLTDPVRREAMLRARDEAKPSVSGRVTLIEESAEDPVVGFLFFIPVYKSGLPFGTLEQRRRNIEAFIYAPFRSGTLLSTIMERELHWVPDNMEFAIYDGTKVENKNRLFVTNGYASSALASRIEHVEQSDFFGRTWTFHFVSKPMFDRNISHIASTLALVASILLTSLLFLFIATKSVRQLQLAQVNSQMSILTRELSHRVKNTLAVVQSIASRSLAGRESVEEAREVFMRRLHALAHAHTLLFENLWRGASLHALARQELEPFGARATIVGPDIKLNASSAQTLALVLHELATNALKHGAMSTGEGRIALVWQVKHVESAPVFSFVWREYGGPEVREPTRQGFGRTLLSQRLGHGGSPPEVVFAREGLRYEVSTPLVSITALEASDEEMQRLLEEAISSAGASESEEREA